MQEFLENSFNAYCGIMHIYVDRYWSWLNDLGEHATQTEESTGFRHVCIAEAGYLLVVGKEV